MAQKQEWGIPASGQAAFKTKHIYLESLQSLLETAVPGNGSWGQPLTFHRGKPNCLHGNHLPALLALHECQVSPAKGQRPARTPATRVNEALTLEQEWGRPQGWLHPCVCPAETRWSAQGRHLGPQLNTFPFTERRLKEAKVLGGTGSRAEGQEGQPGRGWRRLIGKGGETPPCSSSVALLSPLAPSNTQPPGKQLPVCWEGVPSHWRREGGTWGRRPKARKAGGDAPAPPNGNDGRPRLKEMAVGSLFCLHCVPSQVWERKAGFPRLTMAVLLHHSAPQWRKVRN